MYLKCTIGNIPGYVLVEDLYKKTVTTVDINGQKGEADINTIYVGTILNCYYNGLESFYDVFNQELQIIDDRHHPCGEITPATETVIKNIIFPKAIRDEEVVKDHFALITELIIKKFRQDQVFLRN